MSFDINKVLTEMKNAAVTALGNELQKVPPYLKIIFENEKNAFKALAEARLMGEISDSEFKNELEREKKVLEAEMLTFSIISKAAAQRAINAALNVLIDAVKIAI